MTESASHTPPPQQPYCSGCGGHGDVFPYRPSKLAVLCPRCLGSGDQDPSLSPSMLLQDQLVAAHFRSLGWDVSPSEE